MLRLSGQSLVVLLDGPDLAAADAGAGGLMNRVSDLFACSVVWIIVGVCWLLGGKKAIGEAAFNVNFPVNFPD